MNVKEIIKKSIDGCLRHTIGHRAVHSTLCLDRTTDVLWQLRHKGFCPRCIVDVGAAQGWWARECSGIWPDAKFLMVDPLIENEMHLKDAVQNIGEVLSHYWTGALGNRDGEAEFFVHADQSSLFDSEWIADRSEKRTVPLKRLDTLLEEIGFRGVDFLKLDVQGAELDVLAGGMDALRCLQVVQCEVSFRHFYQNAPLAHEVISFFSNQGFRILDISDTIKGKDRALLQADIFFSRNETLFGCEQWTLDSVG